MELKNEFKPVTKQDWEAKLRAELRIGSDDSISWKVNESLSLDPIYFKEDKSQIHLPKGEKNNNDWAISQAFNATALMRSNKTLLHALSKGLDAPKIICKKTPTQKEWTNMFKDVFLDYIIIHFELSKDVKLHTFAKSFSKYLKNQKYKVKKIKGSIKSFMAPSLKSILITQDFLPKFKTLCLSANKSKRSSSDPIKLLSSTIIRLEQSIFSMKAQGFSPSKFRKLLFFEVKVDDLFFIEVAKIRALSILVQNVFEAYGLKTSIECPVHAITSKKNYGPDQHTNMIRSTTQAMAAVIGGADLIRIGSTTKSKHSKLSQRIARNLQHILKMESQMHLVQDPASGSYFIDKLTNEMVEKSWEAFKSNFE